MSLPDQGGGDIKKDSEEREREKKEESKEELRGREGDTLRTGRKRWKQDPREDDDDDEDTDAKGE